MLGFMQMSLASLVGVIVGVFHNNTSLPLALIIAGTGVRTLAAHIRVSRLLAPSKPESVN